MYLSLLLIHHQADFNEMNASRPILRCRPRAQYEVHEFPLFFEKSRSCRVVQERALASSTRTSGEQEK